MVTIYAILHSAKGTFAKQLQTDVATPTPNEARIAIAVMTGDEVEAEYHSPARAEQGQAGAAGCDYAGGAGPLESPLSWRPGSSGERYGGDREVPAKLHGMTS
jgi:hypothetical protein